MGYGAGAVDSDPSGLPSFASGTSVCFDRRAGPSRNWPKPRTTREDSRPSVWAIWTIAHPHAPPRACTRGRASADRSMLAMILILRRFLKGLPEVGSRWL